MSVRMVVLCNHKDCENRYECGKHCRSESGALAEAMMNGWRRVIFDRDQCPEHASKNVISSISDQR